MKLDDPEVVRAEYADESRFAVRQSLWSAAEPDVHELVVAAVAEAGAERVIEVGCGRGELAERLTAGLGVQLVAVDQSERMVEIASARGIEAVVGDVLHLPYADGSFDCAVAAWMLYHVPDVDRALSELARVLRPSGRLVAVTNGEENLGELWALIGWRPDYSFSAENGRALLASHFSRVERLPVGGTVIFPDRDSAARYVAASVTVRHLAEGLPDSGWPLVATRSVAVFVAEKAA